MAVEEFINHTTTTGIIFDAGISNFAGSATILIIFIILLLLALCVAFRIPIELTIPLILPLILTAMAYYGEIVPLGGVLLIYMGIMFAKWFLL